MSTIFRYRRYKYRHGIDIGKGDIGPALVYVLRVVCYADCGINAHRHCKDLVVMECRKHAACHGRVSITNG